MSTDTSVTVEAGRRERKKQMTRTTILLSAWALFQQHGVSDTSIRDIAEAADVSVTTVQNHFASKDELVAAVLGAANPQESWVEQAARRPVEEPPITALRRAAAATVDGVDDSLAQQLRHVMLTITRDPELHAASMRQSALTASLIVEAMRERASNHGMSELDLATAATACTSIISFLSGRQPEDVTMKGWMAEVDAAFAKIETGWQS